VTRTNQYTENEEKTKDTFQDPFQCQPSVWYHTRAGVKCPLKPWVCQYLCTSKGK